MIFITGDTHGDYRRLNTYNFPEQKMMTKKDYMIICGDFGGIQSEDPKDKTEQYWLDWLEKKNFTTLFIDGNHENYDRLSNMKVEFWNVDFILTDCAATSMQKQMNLLDYDTNYLTDYLEEIHQKFCY